MRSPMKPPRASGPATSRVRPEPAGPRRLLGRSDRRDAILAAAAVAFAERGFASTSMEDVAAEAGITRLIVYRHFESKPVLYDAVLERVSERLRAAFTAEMTPGRISAGAVRAMLGVAREDPAGFTLLWRHAAREPRFAAHADLIRSRVVGGASELLSSRAPLAQSRWAAATLVAYLVEGVLAWLDEGDPGQDAAFTQMMSRSLPALVRAWSERDEA